MLEETIKAVQAYDWGQSRAPLLELDREIRKVGGHAEHLATIEAGLVEILESDARPAAKQFACKKLSLVGTERSVPALAAMLSDSRTSDMARYALERMPGQAVDDALRDALPKARGRTKVGIINSLSARRDAGALRMLGELLTDDAMEIARAAAAALGRIGGADAVQYLDAAKAAENFTVRAAVLDACLACAEQFRSEGQRAEAEAIYKSLDSQQMPAAIRRAASRGLAAATQS